MLTIRLFRAPVTWGGGRVRRRGSPPAILVALVILALIQRRAKPEKLVGGFKGV